jgi:hypothetical protein
MEGITQEQITGVTQMLGAILQSDNEQRKVKEAEFTALRKEHPGIVVLCLVSILQACPEAKIRSLAAVLMRQTVTLFTTSERNVWKELSDV